MDRLQRKSAWASLFILSAAIWQSWIGVSYAEEPVRPENASRNLFGVTGLIDTPSADMQPDGELAVTTSYFGDFSRNTLTAQIFPGVEGAFRYSIQELAIGRGPQTRTNFDRSFDIKLRLVGEDERWPAVAIGLQDFLGTGIYSSEYIVATKGFQNDSLGHFRVTGGVGWGRFADDSGVPNIFRGIDSRFANRTATTGVGGEVSVGNFFRGQNMGFFGGVEWRTPIDGLTAKVEYTADQYRRETASGLGTNLNQRVPLNFGLEYRPAEGVELGAYYLYGTEIGVRLSLSGNPFRPITDLDIEPGAQPLLPRKRLSNGAQVAGLGDVRSLVGGTGSQARFNDPRLAAVTVHTRLGDVRWADAVLSDEADSRCPEALARAIDAQYGVVDAVTFKRPDGETVCTVALRPKGQHAVRLTSRGAEEYPTDWYNSPEMRQSIVDKLAEELAPEEIGLYGIELGPNRVSIYIENGKYPSTAKAVGRTARALTRALPSSIEFFEITPVQNSLPVATVVLQRTQLEGQVNRPDAADRAWSTAVVRDADPINWGQVVEAAGNDFPRYSWGISPQTPTNFFDPDEAARFDLAVVATGNIEFLPGLSTSARISKRIIGQLDEISRPAGSLVPNRVRSEIGQYLREGDPALLRLSLDYVTKFSQSLYGRVSGGLLERMFAGVSGEVLWKPATQSWGLGLEVNYVQQRDFSTLFEFQDYRTLTGHASVYWNTDFYGVTAQVDAGRYLAGDWGATFSLKRRFANGWEMGGFFTLTEIPFEEFGEGSFDKGLFLSIPFNWITPFETRSRYNLVLRPLTRDGGARLEVSNRLWPYVESTDAGHLRSGWEDFWE